DAARASADHDRAQAAAVRLLNDPLPPFEEFLDRLDRKCVGLGARNVGRARRRTNVDRQSIELYPDPIMHEHALLREIEARHVAFDKARTCEPAKRTQIDMRFLEGIM